MSQAKFDFIRATAESVLAANTTMMVPDLASLLNSHGFRTSYGTPYAGGRGTYRLVSCAYDWVYKKYGEAEAAKIADAFVDSDGRYAYE